MIDYVEMHCDIDDVLLCLESVGREIHALERDYGGFQGAVDIIQELVYQIHDRMLEIEPLIAEQERREDDAQRQDYLRGIGPL